MKINRIVSLTLLCVPIFTQTVSASDFTSIASCKFDGFPLMLIKFKSGGNSHILQIGENKTLELMIGSGGTPMITASDEPAYYSFNLRMPYSITVKYIGASNEISSKGECIFTNL